MELCYNQKYRLKLLRAIGFCFLLCIVLSGCDKKKDAAFSLTPLPQETGGGTEGDAGFSGDAVGQAEDRTVGAAREMDDRQDILPEDVRPASGPFREEPGGREQEEGGQLKACCWVHICGEVENPGVYQMEEGSRICEAVEKAGGFTAAAARDYVNQARRVEDGMKIVIPSEEAAAGWNIEDDAAGISGAAPAGAGSAQGAGLININTADAGQLCTLTGIGAGRAAAIIAYREGNGGFGSIEDIMKVEGIKEGAFAKIKDQICVR